MKVRNYFIGFILMLLACQRELHFPPTPVAPTVAQEKLVRAIVVTNPVQNDYDSMVFRYLPDTIREVHYSSHKDSVTRIYYYQGARLQAIADENALYYTNHDKATRISFSYDASNLLIATATDFSRVKNVPASFVNKGSDKEREVWVYDTSYQSATYDLGWTNRIIYSRIGNHTQLLYDSAVFNNNSAPGLSKTIVNEYSYGPDSSVRTIQKRIYFNKELVEYGTVSAAAAAPCPALSGLRKKLYRNLANWFDAGMVWQNDNYAIFQLPQGPYNSILYKGFSTSNLQTQSSYTVDYLFGNFFQGNELTQSIIQYSLLGRGTSRYTTILRFYYN